MAQSVKLLLEIVRSEILRVLPVPLGALPSVPLPLATGVPTGHLAIFNSWVRDEPTAANTAGTFSHRFLSLLGGLRENDSKASSADDVLRQKDRQPGGSKNRWAKPAVKR